MRILFSSSPFAGHLFPLLPLARVAQASGHDIAVLTSEPLAPALDPGTQVLGAGPMPDVLLAEVARRTGTDPIRDNAPEIVAELFAGARVDLGLEQALAVAERWRPELVVFEQCDFIGPLVAAALGCASAFLADARAYEPAYTAAMTSSVATRYRRHGLEPVEPLAFLDTCPPSLQSEGWTRPPRHRYLRPEPHRQLGIDWIAPDFMDRSDRPVVLVTFGTVFSATPVLSRVLSALRDLDVNAIVTVGPSGDPAALDVDTSRVHVERFVPPRSPPARDLGRGHPRRRRHHPGRPLARTPARAPPPGSRSVPQRAAVRRGASRHHAGPIRSHAAGDRRRRQAGDDRSRASDRKRPDSRRDRGHGPARGRDRRPRRAGAGRVAVAA
jgi:hypothetical protein